jgi:hypothetical protein
MHAAFAAGVSALLVAIWLATTRGAFWPVQAALPLATPRIRERFGGSEALATQVGVAAAPWIYVAVSWRARLGATRGGSSGCFG